MFIPHTKHEPFHFLPTPAVPPKHLKKKQKKKKSSPHSFTKDTNPYPQVALLRDLSNLGANLLAEEANLTLPRLSRASDRRRSQPQHKPQTIAPRNCYQNLKNPSHPSHRETPDLQPFALNHTPRNPKPDDSPMMTTTRMTTKRMVFEGAKRGLTQFGATPSALHRRNAIATAFGFFDRLMTWSSYLQRRCKQKKKKKLAKNQ